MSSFDRFTNEKNKLNVAFRELRKLGYVALQCFSCCNWCAWAELGSKYASDTKIVTYTDQNADVFRKNSYNSMMADGMITNTYNVLYMTFRGDKDEISKALSDAGFTKFEIQGSGVAITLSK